MTPPFFWTCCANCESFIRTSDPYRDPPCSFYGEGIRDALRHPTRPSRSTLGITPKGAISNIKSTVDKVGNPKLMRCLADELKALNSKKLQSKQSAPALVRSKVEMKR